jgi:hypothetical protein
MAFRDSFHEVVPGYRVNGDVMVFAIKGVKDGGLCDGCKLLEIGNFGIGHRTLLQVPDQYTEAPAGYIGVPDVDAVYDQLVLAGMSIVVEGALVNPSSVALLEYTNDEMTAEAVGAGGQFKFSRKNVPAFQYVGNNTWEVPDADFDLFKELALQRLSTVLDVAGQAANAYIHFDGSNDYVEFTGTASGLLDWGKDWTVGINLVEFEVRSDAKFITLFKSGSNAIMLRRGGANHGLYITGNNGATKVGANTWYAPNPGGKLLFTYDGNSATGTPRLKYYIGNVDGTYNLRASYGVNTSSIGGNTVGSEFTIGKRVSSNAVAESLMYVGGLNNFIYADEAIAGPNIAEYFGVNNTYDEAGFYGDLNSWVKMGEDTYPNVVDTLGALTGGSLVDGTDEDFVEIPDA